MRFWTIEAHMELLGEREENEAYLAAQPGTAYVLFLCSGGAVTLDLTGQDGPFVGRWINVATGEWGTRFELAGGAPRPIAVPSEGPWVAVMTRG